MFASRETPITPLHLCWDYLSPAPGGSFDGWVAGPLVWVDGHWLGAHKPCTEILTSGKVKCNLCLTQVKQRSMGYLPLFDKHLRQIVVGIGPRMKQSILQLNHLDPVRVRKGRVKNDPIIVELSRWTSTKPPVKSCQAVPQDLEPWCVQLWKNADLKAWYEENFCPIQFQRIAQPKEKEYEPISLVTADTEIVFTKKRLSEYTKGIRKSKNDSAEDDKPKESKQRNGTH